MLLLAAAAMVASNRVPIAPSVSVEATATVRIISGVRIKFDSPLNADAPRAHDSKVMAQGGLHPARLIEFQ